MFYAIIEKYEQRILFKIVNTLLNSLTRIITYKSISAL